MKTAYVSVTYLFQIEPELVGLDSATCTKEEFDAAVQEHMEHLTDQVGIQADIFPNDIEIEVMGFEEG